MQVPPEQTSTTSLIDPNSASVKRLARQRDNPYTLPTGPLVDATRAEVLTDVPRPRAIGNAAHGARRLVTLSGLTPDHVAAAWCVLIARAGRYEAIVIGEYADSRDRGFVHEIRIDPTAPFTAHIESVSAIRQGAESVGPIDFAALATSLGIVPSTDRHPLFAAAMGPMSSDDSASAGYGARLVRPDLELLWSVHGERVECDVVGSADLFASERIERIADQFVTLLASLTAHPEAPIWQCSAVSEREEALVAGWQGDAESPSPSPSPAPSPSLGQRLGEAAQRWPERTAIRGDAEVWTYAELDERSQRLATELSAHHVGPGSVVAISTDRSPELIGAIVAVLRTGAAYVPIDPTYPESRRRYMLEHSGAAVVVRDGTVDVRATTPSARREVPHDDLGYVIYTSGSTGTPKAVAMSQRVLSNLVDWQLEADFEPGLVTLQFASASFDVSFQEIVTTLLSGGTLVMIDEAKRRDQRALLRHVIDEGVERLFVPNVALRGLVDAAARESDLTGLALREVYTAGEQLRVDDAVRHFFERLPSCRLVNHYGPSETHVATSYQLPGAPSRWAALPPIGRPIANAVAEVLDEYGQRCPIGVPGELWLGGRCVADGYLDDESATAERFVTDPFRSGAVLYQSGDGARWNDAGQLEFLGRLDQQVKFRGMRIEPGEIAVALADNPGVGECFVTVKESPTIGQRLVAYAKLTDPSVSFAALRRDLAKRLPDYMVPTHFLEVAALPLTASGKVDARALPMPEFDRRSLSTAFAQPTTSTESAIVEMWQALLGTNDVGIDDDFFDAGGDSLMAVELFTMLRDRFGVELPLGTLAQNPTVRWIASEAERAGDGADTFTAVVPIRLGTDRRPLFCVHGGSGNVASFPRLARQLDAEQPLYGLQWPGLRFGRFPRAMPALAREYLTEIRAIQPIGPYRLAGQCVGGLLAHEMARQLLVDGEHVELLVMYDSPMLYSPDYRPAAGAPRIPAPLRPLALRSLSVMVSAVRFVKGVEPRVQDLRVRLRNLFRLRVPPQDLFVHAASALAAMSWRHDPAHVDVPTLLVHSGETNAGMLAFTGRWTDGMLGWKHRLDGHIEPLRVEGGHNDLLYGPVAVQVLRDRLDALDAE